MTLVRNQGPAERDTRTLQFAIEQPGVEPEDTDRNLLFELIGICFEVEFKMLRAMPFV